MCVMKGVATRDICKMYKEGAAAVRPIIEQHMDTQVAAAVVVADPKPLSNSPTRMPVRFANDADASSALPTATGLKQKKRYRDVACDPAAGSSSGKRMREFDRHDYHDNHVKQEREHSEFKHATKRRGSSAAAATLQHLRIAASGSSRGCAAVKAAQVSRK